MNHLRLLLALLLLAAFSHASAQDASDTITAIEFRGLNALTSARLQNLITSRVGEPYDPETIRNDIKALSAVARNVEVRRLAEPTGIKVVFIIEENRPIRDISIVGNSSISTDRLMKTIPISKGEVLASDALAKTREKILKDYRAAGHSATNVRIETLDNSDGSVSVQIFIDEGQRIKAESIRIIGNRNLASLRIREHMESRGSWLFFKSYYDEQSFSEDLEAIRKLYVSYGYFDATVRRGEFLWRADKKAVTPTIIINEGPRYTIGSVQVEGATIFTSMEVQAPFSKLAGRPYSAKEMSAAIEKVRSLYGDEGYILTDMDEDYSFDTAAAKVNVTIKINEGRRQRVGDVIIARTAPQMDKDEQGMVSRLYSRISPPVKDETIKREVRLKPGDVYRRNLERQSVDRLERLGVFESVDAHSEPTQQEDVQNLVLDVEEGNTGNFIVGAGYGDATGVYVFATYTERNLFGEARDLQARIMAGTRAVTGRVSYLDSYFRPDGTSMQVDAYKTSWRRRGYDEDELGTSVEFGRPLNEYLKAYLTGRLEYVWLDQRKDFGEDLNNYVVATVGGRLENDTTDSRIWPTEGDIKGAGVEAGVADGPLLRFTGNYETYRTLRDNWIYALNVRGGLMPIPAKEVGITERFFLGGTDDMRGFAFRGAGPARDDVQIGGSTKLLVQNELRYTILENMGLGKKEIPLRGVTFADVGLIGRNPLEIGTPRVSVGTGLRINMGRQVNVGVDLAAPLVKQSSDRTQFVHVKLSSAF